MAVFSCASAGPLAIASIAAVTTGTVTAAAEAIIKQAGE
jgi:hypothetical protein